MKSFLVLAAAALAAFLPRPAVAELRTSGEMTGPRSFTARAEAGGAPVDTVRFMVRLPGVAAVQREQAIGKDGQSASVVLDLAALGVPRFRHHVQVAVSTQGFLNGTVVDQGEATVTLPLPVVTVHGIRLLPGSPRFPELEAGLRERSRPVWGAAGTYRTPGPDVPYPTLFAFEWDSNGLTLVRGAERLEKFIRSTVRKQTYADRAYLVTHSRGGNLARQFLHQTGTTSGNPLCAGAVLACMPATGTIDAVRLTDDAWKDLLPTWPWTRSGKGDEFRASPTNSILRRLNKRKPAVGTDLLLLYGYTDSEADTQNTRTGSQFSGGQTTRVPGDRYVTVYSARGVEVVPNRRNPDQLTERPVVRNLTGVPALGLAFRRSFPSPGYLHNAFLSQPETLDAVWQWLAGRDVLTH